MNNANPLLRWALYKAVALGGGGGAGDYLYM